MSKTDKMDPKFLFFIQRQKAEGKNLSESDVNVIAKIENLDAWNDLKDIKTRSVITIDTAWIVTAQMPASRFEEIAKLPFVTSLKLGVEIKKFNL